MDRGDPPFLAALQINPDLFILPECGQVLRPVYIHRSLLDRVGCSKIRAAITGGHPVSPDVIRFFRASGLNLKHAYGLTEGGGVFQVQPDGEVKPETVGKPLPRTEIKIADDQEVLVASPSSFIGYYKDRKETAATLTDGWLHTGDAGYIDDDGHLVIIGRKQEIMRTKAGEAFSPDFIETRLKFSPYIKESVIFGEGMPYITVMINIDMETVGDWAENRQIPYTTYTDLSQQPSVEELITGEVRHVNTQLPTPMQLNKIILLYYIHRAIQKQNRECDWRNMPLIKKFPAKRYCGAEKKKLPLRWPPLSTAL